ncbi:MAG: tyrosine-type recombinase/integrase [Gammaproteobacteria bacterium]|nr:tyrosine-type recombinase/integrase [Gammaproteobacteria bacterium]
MPSIVPVLPSDTMPALSDQTAALTNPAALYLATLGSVQSRRVMQSRLNRFARLLQLEHWRQIPWRDFDRPWLLLAKEALTVDHCAPDTINATLSLLKGVALQAWELKLISDHRYLRIKNTRSIRGHRVQKRRWLAKDDITALLDHCLVDDRLQGLRDAALLGLLYGCGLRRSEVVSLDRAHLDPSERSIRILGKGNKERLVYPPARAWEMVNEWIDGGRCAGDGPLFCRIRKGGVITQERLTDQAVYYLIKRLIAFTGVKRFSPHDLRGSFISYLLDHGEDIKTVADIVGHADVRTTAAYDRRGEQRKKKANRAIDF